MVGSYEEGFIISGEELRFIMQPTQVMIESISNDVAKDIVTIVLPGTDFNSSDIPKRVDISADISFEKFLNLRTLTDTPFDRFRGNFDCVTLQNNHELKIILISRQGFYNAISLSQANNIIVKERAWLIDNSQDGSTPPIK